ncbi:MAG: hypothetical protein J1F11_03265 [Oscillospiraceae bacterium]|nr:hypothetical protein [Oscillospiraceae bacterium]
MIAQNTIMAVLIGIVITGVIPLLGGLILLAMGKIKGSSFWAGVLAYIIAMIVYSIASGIYAATTMDLSNLASMTTEISAIAIIVMSLLLSVFMALSMGICIAGCMKLRTFQAAVSCGLGFGVSYMLTNAIGLVSIYFQFVQINSGAFDATYRAAIENGFMTKEDFNLLKSQMINTPVSDIVLSTVNSVISALLYVAIAIFIMRGVCSKNTFTGIAASTLVMAASSLPSALDNIYLAMTIGSVISAAAFVFALTMKNKIVPPPKPAAMVNDPFLQAVESSRQDDGK